MNEKTDGESGDVPDHIPACEPNSPSKSPDEILPSLQSWRVLEASDSATEREEGTEIEGESTSVAFNADEPVISDSAAGQEQFEETPIPTCQDTVLLATIESERLTVNPGATITLHVKLLNNGEQTALFELLIEGWIDPAWVDVNPLFQELQPGEQTTVGVDISPPQLPTSRAGTRQIVVVVRSEDYPNRESRQAVSLTVLPYDDVLFGDISPRTVHTSWRQRDAAFIVPLTNGGNRTVQVRVQGQADNMSFSFQDQAAEGSVPALFLSKESLVDLEPGQSETIRGTIHVERSPLLRQRVDRYRILASVVGKQQVPRAASGQILQHPWLGSRQLALGAALLLLIVMIFSLLGMTGLGMMQIVASLPDAANRRAPTPTVQTPAIALVLPVDAPVPTSNPISDAPPIVANGGNGVETATARGTGREASVPLVQPGEISAPGAGSTNIEGAPVAAATASGRDALTYAQMFQEIALRYDMDWRLLAAQAYVESKFDTLALGRDGDLGLMQVLPRTWQEWAPIVGVDNPFDAYSNALVAAAYLDYLRSFLGNQGFSETKWMLVAYNWGPDKLETFLADGNTWDDLPQSLQLYAIEIVRIADSLSE